MKITFLAPVASLCALFSMAALAGTNTWTDTGPNASNVDVAYSKDPAIVFARGGDKFYKSSDGGLTWTAKLGQNTNTWAYALDPSNANVIVVAWANYYAIKRSIDGGETFTDVPIAPDVDRLQFTRDGSLLYALMTNAPYVRRSNNQGTTWSSTANSGLPAKPPGSIFSPQPRAIGIDPADGNTLYVGFRDALLDGIYKSVDGGANWTMNPGMFGVKVWAIEVSHANPLHAYAATESGLYRTQNGGTTWARVPDPTSTGVATVSMASVTFDPANASIIYAGGSSRGEIFRSADGGATWERRDQGVVASRVNSLSVRPGGGGQLLAGTTHTLYRTADAGQDWTVSAAGIRAANVSFVQSGSRLRVGLSDGGLYESLDGNTWTPLNNAGLRASQPNNLFGEVRSISEPGKLFVMLSGGGLTASNDGGATWQPRPPTFNTLNNGTFGAFLTLPGTGLVHLAATTLGIEKSFNDGATWEWSSNGLPTITSAVALVRNADASEIYLGEFTKGIYKSTDGGSGWMASSGNLQGVNLLITALEYDDANNVLVVGTNDGAFVSRDGGVSYTPLTHPTPGTQASIRDLIVEDFDHGAIYLGTIPTIYRSVDKGVTWTALSAGTTPSSFDSLQSLAGDGPGVIYAGRVPTGLKVFTVSPDIELLTTAPTAGNYAIGTQVPWSLTVRNNGPHAATFGRFSWQAPANVSITNLTTSRGNCSVSPGRLLNCDLGILQPAAVANIAMNIRGTAGGTVAIAASAGAAEIDSQPGNQSFANSGVRFVEQVDIAATLTASAATVDSGGTFEYALTVRNNGPDVVSGASFQTTFDARDQYAPAPGSLSLASCTGSFAGTSTCPLPPLASGASATWRWTVTAIPGGARTANAVASVKPDNSNDTNTGNNAATTTLNVRAVNDMGLALAGSASTVNRGTQAIYTLTATNHGVIAATGVVAQLTLPVSLRYSSVTGATCTGTTIVTCDLGTLAPGAAGVAAITVDTLVAGTAGVTAEVASVNPDPNASNNSANGALTIAPVSDLGVTLVSSAASATQNTQFSYTLTATNAAGGDAIPATARVTLSNLLTYSSASGATCTHAAGIVTCDLGTLAPAATVAVTINVSAATVGAASSTAVIQSVAADPSLTDNSASAAVVTIAAPPPPPPPSGGGSSSSSSSSGGGKKGGGAFDYASVLALLALLGRSRRQRARRLFI